MDVAELLQLLCNKYEAIDGCDRSNDCISDHGYASTAEEAENSKPMCNFCESEPDDAAARQIPLQTAPVALSQERSLRSQSTVHSKRSLPIRNSSRPSRDKYVSPFVRDAEIRAKQRSAAAAKLLSIRRERISTRNEEAKLQAESGWNNDIARPSNGGLFDPSIRKQEIFRIEPRRRTVAAKPGASTEKNQVIDSDHQAAMPSRADDVRGRNDKMTIRRPPSHLPASSGRMRQISSATIGTAATANVTSSSLLEHSASASSSPSAHRMVEPITSQEKAAVVNEVATASPVKASFNYSSPGVMASVETRDEMKTPPQSSSPPSSSSRAPALVSEPTVPAASSSPSSQTVVAPMIIHPREVEKNSRATSPFAEVTTRSTSPFSDRDVRRTLNEDANDHLCAVRATCTASFEGFDDDYGDADAFVSHQTSPRRRISSSDEHSRHSRSNRHKHKHSCRRKKAKETETRIISTTAVKDYRRALPSMTSAPLTLPSTSTSTSPRDLDIIDEIMKTIQVI